MSSVFASSLSTIIYIVAMASCDGCHRTHPLLLTDFLSPLSCRRTGSSCLRYSSHPTRLDNSVCTITYELCSITNEATLRVARGALVKQLISNAFIRHFPIDRPSRLFLNLAQGACAERFPLWLTHTFPTLLCTEFYITCSAIVGLYCIKL